jgi:hypothetical protein
VRKARATPSPPETAVAPAEPVAATATAPSTATAVLPSRDELTVAWGDSVPAGLPLKVRSKWRGGRFVETNGGAAQFAVPNEWHLRECEAGRRDVETALASHFGTPIEVVLVVDGGEVAGGARATDAASPDVDEVVDLDALTNAPNAPSDVERVLQVFPGSEVQEEA